MAVTTPRESWTDPRLDDLSKKVDAGFAEAHKKMDEGFERADKKVDAGFASVDADIRELRGEVKLLIYGLVPIGASSVGTFIHSLVSWFA
jgi:hypothetical protein